MSRTSALSLPVRSDGHTLADWAEALMLIEERAAVSRSTLRSRLRDVLSRDESELDLLYSEVRRRNATAPDVYPFAVEETRIVRSAGVCSTTYTYLLLLSLEEAPFRKARRFARVDIGLDLLAIEALRAYLGAGAIGVRFAWPPLKGPDRRPTAFAVAVDWLADLLDRAPGSGHRSPNKKDGGVDVVVWRPFRDRAAAFLVVLAQTTVQTNFVRKAKDIRVHQWNEWIPLGVPPLSALVVPHSIPSTSDAWNDMHYDVNLIIDRMRLCELLQLAEPIDANAMTQLGEWCEEELLGLALMAG